MPVPVLLDMDPGVDDALAILLAMRSPELRVEAITVCGGNISAERCALNALKTLRALRESGDPGPAPPVAIGAWRPLTRSPWIRGSVHGADGLGNTLERFPDPGMDAIDPRYGPDRIVQAARAHADARDPAASGEETLTIVATGPLTNVATAISRDPEALRRVARVVWMGGAYACPGNVTAVAEFNAFFDPEAAQEVMSFGIPVTAVGLGVTHRCFLSRERLRRFLEEKETAVRRFAWEICQAYMDFYQENAGQDACCLHDPLAVGLLLWPELAAVVERHHVEVVCEPGISCGMTVIDRRPRGPWNNPRTRAAIDRIPAGDSRLLQGIGLLPAPPHVDVALDVDADAFIERFLARLG